MSIGNQTQPTDQMYRLIRSCNQQLRLRLIVVALCDLFSCKAMTSVGQGGCNQCVTRVTKSRWKSDPMSVTDFWCSFGASSSY